MNAIFFIYFFISLATTMKKRKFLLSAAVLLTTTLNQRDWIENRTDVCAIHIVGITREPTTIVNFLFMYTAEHTYHKFHADAIHPPPTRLSPLPPLHQCPLREFTKVFAKNSTWCTKIEKVFDEVYALFTHQRGWCTHTYKLPSSSSSSSLCEWVCMVSRKEKKEKSFMVEEKSQKI